MATVVAVPAFRFDPAVPCKRLQLSKTPTEF